MLDMDLLFLYGIHHLYFKRMPSLVFLSLVNGLSNQSYPSKKPSYSPTSFSLFFTTCHTLTHCPKSVLDSSSFFELLLHLFLFLYLHSYFSVHISSLQDIKLDHNSHF